MPNLALEDPFKAPSIEGLDRDEIEAVVRQWFLDNFEDPAENMPYESREGGYQMIWGEFDAREQIEANFPELESDLLDEIIEDLESIAIEWAPNFKRLFDEGDESGADLDDYDVLQQRIAELERLLHDVEASSTLIGDNHPPEEIGLPPYTSDDRDEVEKALAVLKRSEKELNSAPEDALAAAEHIKQRSDRIKDFLAMNGEEMAKNFSSEFGKTGARASWGVLAAAMYAVYEGAVALLSWATMLF